MSDIYFFVMGAGASVSSGVSVYTDGKDFLDENFYKYSDIKTLQTEPLEMLEYLNTEYTKFKEAKPSTELLMFREFCKHNDVYILNQNVDGLLNRLGIDHNYEVHGNVHRSRVFTFFFNGMLHKVRAPDIILYGEQPKSEINNYFDILNSYVEQSTYSEKHKDRKFNIVYWGTSNRIAYTREVAQIVQEANVNHNIIEINPNPVLNVESIYKDFDAFLGDYRSKHLDKVNNKVV